MEIDRRLPTPFSASTAFETDTKFFDSSLTVSVHKPFGSDGEILDINLIYEQRLRIGDMIGRNSKRVGDIMLLRMKDVFHLLIPGPLTDLAAAKFRFTYINI